MMRKCIESQGDKDYRFRLYPDKAQQVIFAKTFGCVRFIYNKMLEDKIDYYQAHKMMLNTTDGSCSHQSSPSDSAKL
ncbi:MAG: helix-turn-helix domain-containing protein [Thermotogae bacterium]|jgi:putative transposase|nr:helix-turn-helix domain-containing protein [Thermotogota bacterium]MCL5032217.1 helix-turn-helix domain-containing protein [Thermotogota bacterium]